MSTKTWFLGLFAIWGMFTFVHRMMVRGESLIFVLAYEAGYTLTMLLMSYVLWLLVRWLRGPQHRPELFKFTLIVTTVLIIVGYLFGGPRFVASTAAKGQLSLRDAARQIMGNSLVAPGVDALLSKVECPILI